MLSAGRLLSCSTAALVAVLALPAAAEDFFWDGEIDSDFQGTDIQFGLPPIVTTNWSPDLIPDDVSDSANFDQGNTPASRTFVTNIDTTHGRLRIHNDAVQLQIGVDPFFGADVYSLTNPGTTTDPSISVGVSSGDVADLLLSGGGILESVIAKIGDDAGVTGSVTMVGGTRWNNSNLLFLGNSGSGSLAIRSGSQLNTLSLSAGIDQPATVLITGADSLLNVTNLFRLDTTDTASSLDILSGGRLVADEVRIWDDSFFLSTPALATVSGTGSELVTTSDLLMGTTGFNSASLTRGELHILNGGRVDVGGRFRASREGKIVLDGGMLDVAGQVIIESDFEHRSGQFNLGPGQSLTYGQFASVEITPELQIQQANHVIVEGQANLQTLGALTVGGDTVGDGLGSLTIRTGSTTQADGAFNINAQGTVTLNGGTLLVNEGGLIDAGRLTVNSGSIQLAAGTTLTATNSAILDAVIDLNDNQTVNARVGANWVWDDVAVGTTGTGTLNIDTAAIVTTSGNANIGTGAESTGTVSVTNRGFWTVGGQLTIGGSGNAVLNIADEAYVNVLGDLVMQDNGGSSEINFSLVARTDQLLDVAQDATLAGMITVDVKISTVLRLGDTFTLIDIGGTQSGSFDNMQEGDLLDIHRGFALRLSYLGGDGNDVVAYAAGPVQPGDANDDGQVTAADLVILDANFGQAGTFSDGDFNGDGFVTAADLVILDANFGVGAGVPITESRLTPIPEPSSLVLLSLAGLLSARRRR